VIAESTPNIQINDGVQIEILRNNRMKSRDTWCT